MKIVGFVAALAEQGPTRGPQNVFVNRRVVKDRTIAHAIIDAYSVASIKERSPEVHLFIDMPRDAVDVNVHPTKAEVRFRDQSYIHELIRRTLGDALGRGPAPELQLEALAGFQPTPSTLPLPHSYPSTFPSRWTAAPVRPVRRVERSGLGRRVRRIDAYAGAGISTAREHRPARRIVAHPTDDPARSVPRHVHHRD